MVSRAERAAIYSTINEFLPFFQREGATNNNIFLLVEALHEAGRFGPPLGCIFTLPAERLVDQSHQGDFPACGYRRLSHGQGQGPDHHQAEHERKDNRADAATNCGSVGYVGVNSNIAVGTTHTPYHEKALCRARLASARRPNFLEKGELPRL